MARVESRSEKRVKNLENINESDKVESVAEQQSVEVTPKRKKRRFSAKEKLRILSAAAECKKVGELGSMLRREGLYSSHLAQWRRLRDEGQLGALSEKKRGRKPDINPLTAKLQDSESQVAALTKRLEKAEEIIDVQKKFAALFGKIIALPSHLTEMS
jgi:transposase